MNISLDDQSTTQAGCASGRRRRRLVVSVVASSRLLLPPTPSKTKPKPKTSKLRSVDGWSEYPGYKFDERKENKKPPFPCWRNVEQKMRIIFD